MKPSSQVSRAGLFPGDSEMARRMRELYWSATAVGPGEGWPQSLKIAVGIMLTSRYPMFIWWGRDLINLYNDGYMPMLGKRHPEALGKSAGLIWSEIWDTIGPQTDAVLNEGRATWNEERLLILERNGYLEEAYFTFSYSPVPDDNGETGGLFCALTEDTQRVLGQRRLSALQELSARTHEQARSVEQACETATQVLEGHRHDVSFALIYLLEDGANVARLFSATGLFKTSPAAPLCVDLGASKGEDAGWPLQTVLASGRAEVVTDLGRRFGALPGGVWPEPAHTAVVLPVIKSGQERLAGFLVAGVSPRRQLNDNYRVFFDLLASHIATAIGHARAYEEERKRAEALAALDRAKTAFFSNVSHEFRTPLTLLLGPVDDALSKTTDPRQRDLLEVAHRNALRLHKLVNTLLDFSRIEAGRVQASYEPTDLSQLTSELASNFRSACERAGLELAVDCPALPALVYVDRDMWEKVVLNLLSNAFKYTLEGRIEVSLHGVTGHVELSVRDTGTGIPRDQQPKVFDRFHRVPEARGRTQEGSGIGLSLVRELVHLHGGEIEVESWPDQGSVFTVTVPLGKTHLPADRIGAPRTLDRTALGAAPFVEEALRWVHSEPDEAVRRQELDPGSFVADPSTRPRILLADDNADMRHYLVRLLEGRYEVEAVSDGEAALAAALRDPPDLVLADVMMPHLDGFGLLRGLRADPNTRALPVILLSARAGEESRIEGLQAGADDYLVKPFGARELLARVGGALALAKVRRDALLREAEIRAEFVDVLESMTDGFMALGSDWSINYVNAAAERTNSMTRESLLGRSFWEAFPDVVGTDFERGLRRAMAERVPIQGESLYQPYGRWFQMEIQPVDGGGLAFYGRDITERRRAHAEREELLESERVARAEAERAARIKDDFLATLSHELRTPLSAIVGWTSLIKKGISDPEKVRRGVEVIERNARGQAQLIGDLLDLSRITTGKMRLDIQRLELPAVIDAAVEAVRPAAEARRIHIHSVIEPITQPVHGDAARLQQILWNLLSNAVKFTPEGGRVQVGLTRVSAQVEITVSDTGRGIRPEFLPHVFERFRQADASAAREHGGLGIGLSLVKQLTELHGGEVRAASEGEGRGSTFIVKLPLAIPQMKDEEPRQQPRAPAPRLLPVDDPPPELSGVKVLVVDDEPDVLEVIKRLLEDRRAEVATACNVEDALLVLESEQFDVLLSDIGMPKRDGYEFMSEVRRRGVQTPAAALTAFARSEDRTRSLRSGYQAHLTKPVEPSELLTIVASLSGRIAH